MIAHRRVQYVAPCQHDAGWSWTGSMYSAYATVVAVHKGLSEETSQKRLCYPGCSHRDIAGSHHDHGELGEVARPGEKVSAPTSQIKASSPKQNSHSELLMERH